MTRPIVRLDADRLTEVLASLYEACGCSPTEARIVSAHLVGADLAGHPSHGTGLTPLYLAGIGKRTLIPNRTARRIETKGDFLLFDGERGFGQAIGLQVCDAVATMVEQRGCAVFGVRNAHHMGRIGTYGEYLAERGLISATFTNVASRPMVSAFHGRAALLGTNPVCICIPRPNRDPILLDFATSTIAIGKVRVALENGRPVPEGTLIDRDGNPTTDPSAMYPQDGGPSGALTPMGGYKGAGLNLICELLSAAINGATMAETHGAGVILNNMVGMAFPADATEGASSAVEAALEHFLATPMLDDGSPVLPGEPETRSRKALREAGLAMPEQTWEAIVGLGAGMGISVASFDAARRE